MTEPKIPEDRIGLILYGLRLLVKDGDRFMYGPTAERARKFVIKVDEKLNEGASSDSED